MSNVAGALQSDEAQLYIDGIKYEGWTSMTVRRSLEAVSGTFSLGLTEPPSGWKFNPGVKCVVKIGADTVISGHLDSMEASLSDSDHQLGVSGRDYTGDLVDCSVPIKPAEWSGKTFPDIAKQLCEPFGMGVVCEAQGLQPIDKFSIQPGETVLEALARPARAQRLLLSSTPEGKLLITRAGKTTAAVELKEGENIKGVSASFDASQRYSVYTVNGQPADTEKDGHFSSGSAQDSAVKRYRPLLIVADEQASDAYCKERALFEAKTRSGKSISASVTVVGWRQKPGGPLWKVNQLVTVSAPSVHVKAKLLIVEVEFQLGSGGHETQLTLRSPLAYSEEPELEKSSER